MKIDTPLFGVMDIPDDKDLIKLELNRCRKRYLETPTRYLLARIDCLEEALDSFRRPDHV